MRTFTLRPYAYSICAACALLAGCGGSQPPVGAPSAMAQTWTVATRAERGKSWMPPETKPPNLIFVGSTDDTGFYTYPGEKHLGAVSASKGLCSDAHGNVFTADTDIAEYAHMGGRLEMLSISGDYFQHCSVDPVTGNLAATLTNLSSGDGVAVFKHAKDDPTVYGVPAFGDPIYCGYDNGGNLFIFGPPRDHGHGTQLAELPEGAKSLVAITLSQKVNKAGQIQWDGRHMTIEDREGPVVYRLQITGTSAKVIDSSHFSGVAPWRKAQQSWIYRDVIVFPFGAKPYSNNVGVWKYPQGGAPLVTFRGPGDDNNQAATMSVSQ